MADHKIPVTIRKIAADLQLAVSTVSKALSDSYEISTETKRRVLDYVNKVNYVPNTYARNLKKHKTGNIAVVIPEVADSFFSEAINGIEAIAQAKHYHVMIYLTHEDQQREHAILNEFRSGRVDGVLLSVSGGENQAQIRELTTHVPVVMFDRVYDDIDTFHVVTNDFDAGYAATEHLITKRCAQIAFLSMGSHLPITHKRSAGYLKAMNDYGFKVKDQYIIDCGSDHHTHYTILKKLFSRKNRPDGVIASVEKLSTLVYQICHEEQLSIPRHVKVVGFSNLKTAAWLNPSLTTITQPAFEIGKTAATFLFNTLDPRKKTEAKPERKVIPSILEERASTGKK